MIIYVPWLLYSFQWQKFPERWTQSDLHADGEETSSAAKQLHVMYLPGLLQTFTSFNKLDNNNNKIKIQGVQNNYAICNSCYIYHPRSSRGNSFGRICLYVCNTITLESLDLATSFSSAGRPTSSEDTGQVRMKLSGRGRGHRNAGTKKREMWSRHPRLKGKGKGKRGFV